MAEYSNYFNEAIKILNLSSDISFDMEYWQDIDGNFIQVSPACERITGYRIEEFVEDSKIIENIILDEDLHSWLEHKDLTRTEEVHETQFRIKRKNGDIVWIEHVCQNIYDENGNLEGFRGSNRDITKRKLTSDIYKISPAVLFLWENKSGWPIKFVSENIEKLSGYTVEDFIDKNIEYIDIIFSEDVKKVVDEVNKFSSSLQPEFEHSPYRIVCKNGAVKWVEDKTQFIKNKNGEITHYQGSITDITSKIETEIKLKRSEKKYHSHLNVTAEGFWVINSNKETIEVNDSLCKMLGYSKDEIIGRTPLEFTDDENSNIFKNQISKISTSLHRNYEIVLQKKNGGKLNASIKSTTIRDEYGKPQGAFAFITDITLRKKAEFALRQSEQLYRSVFENSPLGIFHFDINGVILDCNDELFRIIGTDRNILIGFNMFDKLENEKLKEEIKKTVNIGSGHYEGVYTSVTTNKKTPVIVYLNAIFSDKNKITGGVGLVEDTTERVKINEALRKSRNKYHDLFEKSKDPILIIQDGKFIDCNQATVELLKYKKKSDLLLTHPSELSPAKQSDLQDSKLKAEEMMNIAIEKGSHRFEWAHIKSDGEIFPVEVLLTPITGEDGSKIIHTVWRDITERKKREALKNALFRITEEANKTESIDSYYKTLHKIIKELMPAKNFYIAIHDYKSEIISFPYHVDEFDSPPEPKPFGKGLTEYVIRTRQSQVITSERDKQLQEKGEVEISGASAKLWVGIYLDFAGQYDGVLVLQDYNNEHAYDDENVKLLQFVSEQIVKVLDKEYAASELKKSYEELFLAKKELEQINANKDRFFSIIAHDLRSPFMALMGLSKIISEDLDEMSVKELRELTETIHESAENLFKLIENLLSWSRIQMNTFQIIPKEFNFQDVANSVYKVLKLSAETKHINIINNIDKVFVNADEDCVKTILRNLVNNAIKFTENHGVIKISTKVVPGFVEVSVEDNGLGINSITKGKLFNISEKISEKGTNNEIGTGLGLILCKDLVEKNGGNIWVESEEGLGSKFSFTLPNG